MIDNHIGSTRDYVLAAFQNETEPLWFPCLIEPITCIAWGRLQREIALSPASYSTTRLLLRDRTSGSEIAYRCSPRSRQNGESSTRAIPVEVLTADVARKITPGHVRHFSSSPMAETVRPLLEDAFSLLDLVPTVWPTILEIVRALHIIDPGNNETDVSFSDPSLPFSIFISVPSTRTESAALRVAEAILHESMHLHLTLMAREVPLVQSQGQVYYSPWRDEQRDSEGILQALYVFSVIRSFLVEFHTLHLSEANDYVTSRITLIESQIKQTQSFRDCDELTPQGTALVARLLNVFE